MKLRPLLLLLFCFKQDVVAEMLNDLSDCNQGNVIDFPNIAQAYDFAELVYESCSVYYN